MGRDLLLHRARRRAIPLGYRGAPRKARLARRRDADGAWADFSSEGCSVDCAVDAAATLRRQQSTPRRPRECEDP